MPLENFPCVVAGFTQAGAKALPPLPGDTADLAGLRVISERQAAAVLGLSTATMERLRATGTGPRAVRLTERRLGYRVCDLAAWIEERASASHEAA